MELKEKFLEEINKRAVITNKGTGDVYAAQDCARIAIEHTIEVLQEGRKWQAHCTNKDWFDLKLKELKEKLK